MEELFLFGQCYQLFLMIKAVWKQAQAYYSPSECHVYTLVDGGFYDIRGKHLRPPEDLTPLDHQRADAPHRWATRDSRDIISPSQG